MDSIDARQINQQLTNCQTLSQIFTLIRPHISSFNYVNCATAWHRLAKVNRNGQQFDQGGLTSLANRTDQCMASMDGRCVANIIWSMAKLKHIYANQEMVSRLSQAILKKIDTFNSQEIANSLWALATLNYPDEASIRCLAQTIPNKIDTFNGQSIGNSLWALANLKYPIDDSVKLLLNECDQKRHIYSSIERMQIEQAKEYYNGG